MLPPIWLALHGHLLWWAALALALAGGWQLERAVRRWRSRRAWRARAGSTPRARGEVETDAPVRLTGTLRVEGEATRRFEDGEPAAAASAAAGPRAEQDAECVSVRAARVWLDTEQGPIELRGPIDVVGGRTVRTAGAPSGLAWSRVAAALGDEPDWAFTSLPVELRSVASGDRVEVAGTLERAIDGDGSDYRSAMRRVLVPVERSILVQLAAPAPVRSWRGPLVAIVAFAMANVALVRAPQPWDDHVDVLALVNPVTRSHAMRVLDGTIRERRDAALAHGPPLSAEDLSLAALLWPDQPCHERARFLRASGDPRAALREAERCGGMPAVRERTLALFALGREDDARASWQEMLREADACALERHCIEAIEIATSGSYLDWGRFNPSEVPRDLFLGRWGYGARPHLAHRLHALLESMELRSGAMRRARIQWTLELAAFEIELDELGRASELLDEVRRLLTVSELPAASANPLLRDADHLQGVVFLRRGDLEHARQMVHANDGHVPCPMRGVLAAARDPFTNGPEVIAGSHYTYGRILQVFSGVSSTPPSAPIRDGDSEGLAWIDLFGRVRRAPEGTGVLRHLGPPRTCGGERSFDAAAWDAALARAFRSLGDASRAARIRSCVRLARGALLGLPPLERHP